MGDHQYNKAQLEYIEAAAIAIAVGLSSNPDNLDSARLADTAHCRAEAMLYEREKRYGRLEHFQ